MNFFIRIAIITAFFTSSNVVLAEIDNRVYSQGEVFIEYREFNKDTKTEEEINIIKRCGLCPGIDGHLPFTETIDLWLLVRGYKFTVPKSLITPLYNLHVGPEFYERTFSVEETKNGVFVNISGGDGAGSYDVHFDINLIDMQVERKLYQYPDMEKPEIVIGNVIDAEKSP